MAAGLRAQSINNLDKTFCPTLHAFYSNLKNAKILLFAVWKNWLQICPTKYPTLEGTLINTHIKWLRLLTIQTNINIRLTVKWLHDYQWMSINVIFLQHSLQLIVTKQSHAFFWNNKQCKDILCLLLLGFLKNLLQRENLVHGAART